MHAKPTLPQSSSLSTAVAAAFAAFIAIGTLSAVAFLFQRDGTPFEVVASAERACVGFAYVSEREACIRDRLAAAQKSVVASR